MLKQLNSLVDATEVYVAPPITRYDAGHRFELSITGVHPAVVGTAVLEVEKFIGGGFAGQVYRCRLVALDVPTPVPGLEPGKHYAIKIIVPPSGFSEAFRNVVYWLAYQGPFAAQVNHDAARTGVLWQKLIRRAAALHFDNERCVADTHATFFDDGIGSYGEINEWVEGRNWNFEVDDRLFKGRKERLESEFTAKKQFMAKFVRLLHQVGAPEFARQYEWWTCKSQPNVLKRLDAGDGPRDGLTAIDFRAGLALLPFLPMSPADIKLILKGFMRGALVQFDRGDLRKLEAFCDEHAEAFADLRPALEELKQTDPAYRRAQPDITRQGLTLLVSSKLRRDVKAGLVEGWRVRRLTDDTHAAKLNGAFFRFFVFFALGFVPIFGRLIRKMWCVTDYRKHVFATLTSRDYLKRNLRAHQARTLSNWLREGRVTSERAQYYLDHPVLYWRVRFVPGCLPLPAGWFRFFTEWRIAGLTLAGIVVYPIKFYRDAAFRVQWLTSEVECGAREGMLTEAEKEHILERVPDPFIQKYLKCVAVHVCTLPVTQVIALFVAIYAAVRYGKSWQESFIWAGTVLVVFQALPVSPGSLVRGSYVVYLMIRERNWRNYWLAALVSFWHYIGYLGFPLQMVSKFPALARFMGGRWATKMVRIIPVFGEHGALLEHWVFNTFFNVPLSLKRLFSRNR